MKNYLLTGGFAAMLLLSACGSEEPTQEEADQAEAEFNESSADASDEQTEEATEEQTEESSESDKGSRSNPYKVGETAEITISDYDDDYEAMEGKANVTIENVLRGEEAFNYINEQSAGTHDQPDEEGLEWIVFDVTFELEEYVDDDTSYVVSNNFSIFNEDGEQVSPAIVSVGDSHSGNTVFQGGTLEGKEGYAAPSEGSFLLKYADAEEDIFFEVE